MGQGTGLHHPGVGALVLTSSSDKVYLALLCDLGKAYPSLGLMISTHKMDLA
jgi:hypothetical protein